MYSVSNRKKGINAENEQPKDKTKRLLVREINYTLLPAKDIHISIIIT